MFHLFNSAVRVEELLLTQTDGKPQMVWVQATSDDPDEEVAAEINAMLEFLKCRIDTNFIRPGKDILPAPVAGKAPDHVAIMFTYPYAPIKAGQRVVAIPNEFGKIPVPGTWDIRVVPDLAIDFSDQHHIEVQIVETSSTGQTEQWPDNDDPVLPA